MKGQTVKKVPGGVGGLASPLTAIVSGGFAAGAGLSRLRRESSLQIRRPGAWRPGGFAPSADGVPLSQKSGRSHFFDTLTLYFL